MTEAGDISFVVVYQDPELNSIYNRFDSDPWYLRKKDLLTNINDYNNTKQNFTPYPNPTSGMIYFKKQANIATMKVFNSTGTLIYEGNDSTLNLNSYPNGIYFISIINNLGEIIHNSVIKK